MSEVISAALAEFPFFRQYQAGDIGKDEYLSQLASHASAFEQRARGAYHALALASRYPPDFEAHAESVFRELAAAGFVPRTTPSDGFAAFRDTVRERYDHGDRWTYINPDEAKLVYLLSMAVRPRLLVVMGSYYGYWAVWAMPGVSAAGGRAILIDPDPAVCRMARSNFRAMGYGSCSEVLESEAQGVLPTLEAPVDMALLDAYNPKREPDPSHHGKGIYAPLTEALYGELGEGGLLVAHNDYLPGVGDNALARPFLEPACRELAAFHAFCTRRFRRQRVVPTPDGIGVYVK